MRRAYASVTLVRGTLRPAELIASAARLCYADDAEKVFRQDDAEAGKFVGLLKRLGHMSPIEHASFTFYIEGVPRVMTHQLVRHRIASYSQRSQRYVDHGDFDYVVPPQLEGKNVRVNGELADAVAYFEETMGLIADRFRRLNEALGQTGERSNEDARYVLPNACETKIFVTMNARQLHHFFQERLCRRAQWEIRAVAEEMLRLAKQELPAVFRGAGPKCVHAGRCPEGRMTCGRYEEVVEHYRERQ